MSVPPQSAVDLAPALTADGTFVGGAGIEGAVDSSAWTLVSNLAAGEPPRFEPATTAGSPGTAGVWSGLGSKGADDGALNDLVRTVAVVGSDLYVGGDFTDAAGIPEADNIAMWNGSAWSALGSNGSGNGAIDSQIWALAVLGTDLYVAGGFPNAAGIPTADYLAKWNGTAWSALGSNGAGNGALNGPPDALVVSGGKLYVGGGFTNAAGIPEADCIAVWNGTAWSALGSNGAGDGAIIRDVGSWVQSVAVSGSDVYVGGTFHNAAGIAEADYIAKWDGNVWSALGSNGSGDGPLDAYANQIVRALAISGTDLYVGGSFFDAAGIPEADKVAMWDGTAWSALGSNGANDGALKSDVFALAVSDSDLYVGGRFSNAAGMTGVDHVAKWDGSTWSALGSNGANDGALNHDVFALTVSGSDLYVGGRFTNAAGIAAADRIAKWDGSGWSALGSNGTRDGAINGFNDAVFAVAVSGSDLYVGGSFFDAAGIPEADFVAKWDGHAWSALGSDGAGDGALHGEVYALAVSGRDLYVGGTFYTAAGIPGADNIAKWNGSAWTAVGTNGTYEGFNDAVFALALSGTDLYVGGWFTRGPGLADADYLAKWNGSMWTAVGSGAGALNDFVHSLAVSGGDLYVGGRFTNAAGIAAADYIAKWNGTAWSALGSNGSGGGALNNTAMALAVSDSDLYVGGYFSNAAGLADADYLAKWNGSRWSAVDSNGATGGALNDAVLALTVSGNGLYVGGVFSNAAGIAAADHLAIWDGSAWSAAGSNDNGGGALNDEVDALAGSGSDLYVGGVFTNAASIATADYVAKWSPAEATHLVVAGFPSPTVAGAAHSLTVTAEDAVGNTASGYRGTLHFSSSDGAASLPADYTFSAADAGVHVFSLTLNTPGTQSITATDTAHAGLTGSQNGITVNAAEATHLVVAGFPSPTVAGAAHSLTVTAEDAVGNTASGYRGTLHFSSSDGAASLPADYTFSAADAGVHVFSLTLNTPGTQSITATDTAHAGLTGSQNGITVNAPIVRQPDARIRLGTGAFVGNNVYNTNGGGQKRSGSAKPGHSLTFSISIQNDGTASDTFTVKATGTTVSGYRLKYFSGSTDITAAVVAGTYQTASLAPGAKVLITAKVTIKSAAARHSSLTRRVTLTSVGDPAKQDTVKLVGKRG